ncbi:MAG: LamG domain-containing protein, partial [Verrucomicrobiota bacterium]
SLGPNESVTLEVSVDPEGMTGNFAAGLEVRSNDPSSPVVTFDLSAFLPVAPNLIAHYRLDESEGSVMNDASGFGRHGFFDNNVGLLELGQEALATGAAARFVDGAYAEVGPEVLPVLGDFTFSLWVRNGETNTAASLISRGNGQGDPFALLASGTSLLWFSGGEQALSLEDVLTLDTAHHIAVATEGTGISIYVDGVMVGSGTGLARVDREANALQFGAANGILGMNGVIDEIQLYDRPLTGAEIGTLAQNPGAVIGGGASEPVVRPVIRIMPAAGAGIELAWPVGGQLPALEESGDLIQWSPVTELPVETDGVIRLSLPNVGKRFFRWAR